MVQTLLELPACDMSTEFDPKTSSMPKSSASVDLFKLSFYLHDDVYVTSVPIIMYIHVSICQEVQQKNYQPTFICVCQLLTAPDVLH